jgi:hypothetical protein
MQHNTLISNTLFSLDIIITRPAAAAARCRRKTTNQASHLSLIINATPHHTGLMISAMEGAHFNTVIR